MSNYDVTMQNVKVITDALSRYNNVLKEFPFMYVSEAIKEDYKQWRDGDYVFIDAPTGTGKTTFIYEKIIVKALKDNLNVLLVSNRIALNMQQKRKIYDIINEHKPEALGMLKKENISKDTIFIGPVCVITYQSLHSVFSSEQFTLYNDYTKQKLQFMNWCSNLQYAVFDEIHFLYADAEFNSFCGYIANYIPYVFQQVTRIYITATSWDIIDYIQKYEEQTYPLNSYNPPKPIENKRFNILSHKLHFYHYIIKPDYSKYKLMFFDLESAKTAINAKLVPGASDNDSLICRAMLQNKRISKAAAVLNIMDPPPSKDNKWIVFVDSKNEGNALKKLLKEAGVSAAYVDRDTSEPQKVRNDIIQYEKFSQPVLITTQVLDNGINICDEAVKNIVIFYTDRTEFIQALGRKRLLSKETGITIWAWVPSRKSFNRRWNRYNKNIFLALSTIYSAEALRKSLTLIMSSGMNFAHLVDYINDISASINLCNEIIKKYANHLTDETRKNINSYVHINYLYKQRLFSQTASNEINKIIHGNIQATTLPTGENNIKILSGIISMYLSAKRDIENDRKNEIVKSLFFADKMGLYSIDLYALGVVAKKARILGEYLGKYITEYSRKHNAESLYRAAIAEWLGKDIRKLSSESYTNAKIDKDRMLSEVIKALDDNADKPLTVDEFSPIKCKIVQTHIQHLGIRPITKRRERWEGYSAKSVNKLLSDLELKYTTTKSKKLWLIHKISTEN